MEIIKSAVTWVKDLVTYHKVTRAEYVRAVIEERDRVGGYMPTSVLLVGHGSRGFKVVW